MCEWMKSACSESAVGSPSMSSVVSERYFLQHGKTWQMVWPLIFY